MGYAQELYHLRNDIKDAVRNRNGGLAQKKSLEYVEVLKTMLGYTKDASKVCVLQTEIEKYKNIADKAKNLLPPSQILEDEWVTELFERYLSATLVVETDRSSATGFFINSDGWALTNHHVIDKANTVSVSTGDGQIKTSASVIAVEKERDVALLKADVKCKTEFIKMISDYDLVKPGAGVMLIGNALAEGLAPICGTVKFVHEARKGDLIYTAPSNVGDSGAPVINRQGLCVGINKSATTAIIEDKKRKIDTYGLTHATPADELRKFLDGWAKKYKFIVE